MSVHRKLIFAAALSALAAGPALAQEAGLDQVEMSITISPVTDAADVAGSTVLDSVDHADEPGEYTIVVPLHGDRDGDRDGDRENAEGAGRGHERDHEADFERDHDHEADHDGSPDLDLEPDHDRAGDVGGDVDGPDLPDAPETGGDTATGDAEHRD